MTSEEEMLYNKRGEREFFKMIFLSTMLNVPHFMLEHLLKLDPDVLFRKAKVVEEL